MTLAKLGTSIFQDAIGRVEGDKYTQLGTSQSLPRLQDIMYDLGVSDARAVNAKVLMSSHWIVLLS